MNTAERRVNELIGDIDPRDYGFDVIVDEPPSEEEQVERVLEVYVQARDRTGVTSPKMERLLEQRAVVAETPAGTQMDAGPSRDGDEG